MSEFQAFYSLLVGSTATGVDVGVGAHIDVGVGAGDQCQVIANNSKPFRFFRILNLASSRVWLLAVGLADR